MSEATSTNASTSNTWPIVEITMRMDEIAPFFPPGSFVQYTVGHDSDGTPTVTFDPAIARLGFANMDIQNTILNGATGSDRMDPSRGNSRFFSQWMVNPDGSRGETVFTVDDRDPGNGRRTIVTVHNPEHIKGAEVWNKATREAYGKDLEAYEASHKASQGSVADMATGGD